MLNTLVEVEATIPHSFFFYDIIIVDRRGPFFPNSPPYFVRNDDSRFRGLLRFLMWRPQRAAPATGLL
jgi:hypothetical protein